MQIQNESRQETAALRGLCNEVYREIRKTEGNPRKRKWADFKLIFRDKPRAKYVYFVYRDDGSRGGVLSLPLKPHRQQIAKLVAWFIYRCCYGAHSMRRWQVDISYILDGPLTKPKPKRAAEQSVRVRDQNHEKARVRVENAKKTLAKREADIEKAIKVRDRAARFLTQAEQKLRRYDREAEKRGAAPVRALANYDFAKRMAAKRGQRGQA